MLLALLFSANLACEATILHGAWDLLSQSMWGRSERERAAFVLRDNEGDLVLSPWPYNASSMEASTSSIPDGVVAILHTHPNERRNPSSDDAALARKLGIPVFVVTRYSIRATNGSGIEAVWNGDWNPDRPRAQTSCR